MDTYTVTRVTKTGQRLTGSPSRTYRAANAMGAGALYVAAEGIDGARFAGGDAGLFTFNPPADGAPMHVLVEAADESERPVYSVKTRNLTYMGSRARVTTTKHERSNSGLRTVEFVWIDDATEDNGGYRAGTRVVKVMHGSGIPGSKVPHVLHSTEVYPPVGADPVEDTVSTREVWRCAGGDGSMYAKRDAFGFVEVFASNLDSEREAGTHLFKIVL